MAQKVIFAKPLPENFVFISVFQEGEEVYLDDAFFAESAKELNSKIAEYVSKDIETIRYDVSVFMQEGKDLRGFVPDTHVFCYKPKQPLELRIEAQSEWIKDHLIIDDGYENEDYKKFVELLTEYSSNDRTKNTIALDVLSDVAKHYRRR